MFSDVNRSVLTRRAFIIDRAGDCTLSIAPAVLVSFFNFNFHTIFHWFYFLSLSLSYNLIVLLFKLHLRVTEIDTRVKILRTESVHRHVSHSCQLETVEAQRHGSSTSLFHFHPLKKWNSAFGFLRHTNKKLP